MKFFRAILFLIFITGLGLVFYRVRHAQVKEDPAFATVTGWAQNCFQAYQEFDAALAPEEPYPATILPWQLLRHTVDSYIETYAKSDFYKEACWIDGKIPPQDFLELIPDNKIFDMLATFFANKKKEAAEMEAELSAIDFKHPFVQVLRLDHPCKICFIGDIHSLNLNLI